MHRLLPDRLQVVREACAREHIVDTPLTETELKQALKEKCTAPGEDRITYSVLFNAGMSFHQALLSLCNKSFATGKLPVTWKKALISPILKHSSPCQWRPISLISTISKTIERIINNRRAWVLAPQHHHVFVFCPVISTHPRVSTLLSAIQERKAIAVFLDLAKAFDLASPTPILSALASKGVSGRLLTCLQDFLSNRSATVPFQGYVSSQVEMDSATPQDSILSPLPF